MAPLPTGGPVCGGVVTQTAGEALAAGALPAGAAAACGPAVADLTTLAGPVVPLGLPPGPVPPVPIAPIPPIPGAPPPIPLVAPGPAGAAAASPVAGMLTDAIGAPIGLAGGTK
ncbi:hypothetical protein A5648_15285 [Mycolicibacter sinensis]|uniref:Uncharacterized protein n=1 Tax=Mycolicibacter sinensis (strain JDM601) TaxID=875328 RepID=A0A1A3U993_MYCSD|nr:hypothetical protein A5648_15285 [Mycolicibacter sinensis]